MCIRDRYNVIPDEVVIEGTIRTLEEEVRQFAAKRIGEISQATAAVFGGSVDYEMIWGAPPVINDNNMAALAAKAAKTVSYTHLDVYKRQFIYDGLSSLMKLDSIFQLHFLYIIN